METLTAALTVVIVLLVFALAYIDARTGYLPDVLTLPLGLVALLYHWSLNWVMFTAVELVFSSAVVGLVLLAVRYVGNRIYVQDSFGLGDVKFLTSSTLLLGFVGNIWTMLVGFLVSIVVMIFLSIARQKSLKDFSLPLGPGLGLGVLAVFLN